MEEKQLQCMLVHAPKFDNWYKPLGDYIWINYLPIGIFALADNLARHGYASEIVHLGIEWIEDHNFDIVEYVGKTRPQVVALSLHWHYQSYDVIKVGIWPAQRQVLHQRIAQRLEEMFAEGFIDEVRRLSRREELDASLPAMRAVGYRQVLEYLRGDTTYEIMRERCLAATRQLAKRQLTWLRHDPDIVWFDTECPGFPGKVLEFICKRLTV